VNGDEEVVKSGGDIDVVIGATAIGVVVMNVDHDVAELGTTDELLIGEVVAVERAF